jgi:hypothetical protein
MPCLPLRPAAAAEEEYWEAEDEKYAERGARRAGVLMWGGPRRPAACSSTDLCSGRGRPPRPARAAALCAAAPRARGSSQARRAQPHPVLAVALMP